MTVTANAVAITRTASRTRPNTAPHPICELRPKARPHSSSGATAAATSISTWASSTSAPSTASPSSTSAAATPQTTACARLLNGCQPSIAPPWAMMRPAMVAAIV